MKHAQAYEAYRICTFFGPLVEGALLKVYYQSCMLYLKKLIFCFRELTWYYYGHPKE